MRFLFAVLAVRPWLATGAALLGALWLVPGALLPLAVGQAVDVGVAGADTEALLAWIGLIVALGLAQAGLAAGLMFAAHGMWIHGAATTHRTVAAHVARLGAALSAQAGTGEVMAISSSDEDHIGYAFEVLGRLFGSMIAFLVVGIALLRMSPLLAAVALIGVPAAALGMGPLIGLLQRRMQAQRAGLAEVNALAADIVSGLRILRGIGGERQFLRRFQSVSQRVRRRGVAVARSESWVAGAEVLLPGLITVLIAWLGARLAVAGTITVGELVAFYGAAAFLVLPVATVTEATGSLASALVAAKKVCAILRLRPLLADPADPVALPDGPLELHDTTTGVTAVAGKLTVVEPGPQAPELAARLARFADPEPGQQVLLSGIAADRVALAALRRRVVSVHSQDLWFSGVLREQLRPDHETGVDVAAAMWAADVADIVAGLPNGLDEPIGERGREVSGGQRQRLILARALALDADVLLLDQPTSAVDAHTEARIAHRVARLRRGRTTVVFSESPLWAQVADEVIRLSEVSSCR
ncbi:ABC transporter transmembrane domain-containing protein [Pseudonocardia hispaniensis]|uniref:ABC transporter transmembrane domain-containing protein n=1 Tax=Pseudonocardia hispaniensis TaxID=904933 RepID=A0ABW1J5U1_9PSEU